MFLLSLANRIQVSSIVRRTTHNSQLILHYLTGSPTTNRRRPSFRNLFFLNILHRLLCYWPGRNRSAPISTYTSQLKTLLLIADGNQDPAAYRINGGLVRLSLSNSSSYIITRDPRISKNTTITRSQNFKLKRLDFTR